MNRRERGSQEQGLYPTQDTSRMRTARVKREEKEVDTKIIVELKGVRNLEEEEKSLTRPI